MGSSMPGAASTPCEPASAVLHSSPQLAGEVLWLCVAVTTFVAAARQLTWYCMRGGVRKSANIGRGVSSDLVGWDACSSGGAAWMSGARCRGTSFRGDSRWLGIACATTESADQEVVVGYSSTGMLYAGQFRTQTKASVAVGESQACDGSDQPAQP